ncbi:ATP-binding cassette domain-containing protein [Methylomonas sp. SURF-2]|uniref:ATP-binding cassette domain-containing protein n=1 Tax=Methylomonas subterranea TaxID=2952225 RepID=A0ABT1TFU7_9GAMM|nr:ATP-binding cassette domain-containing protein [Methylomonas sp. SURF-2]MCQ8103624.1 ATP-binding cassette domain-containing protein [Methylomonas sp. SURF-2]
MPAVIRFDEVSVGVDGKNLLSRVSFSLRAGEKALLGGKSGSGKSTVLKTLLGMRSPTAGVVYFNGQPLNPITVQNIRRCIAYIGQEPVLGADTVRNALLLPFQFKAHRHLSPPDSRLKDVLQRLRLPVGLLSRDCAGISGGEKQRLALARGLLLQKTVYLLDEVTSALDAESKQAVFEVFADPQLTLLAVAHDPDWLERSQTVFEMHAGQMTRTR